VSGLISDEAAVDVRADSSEADAGEGEHESVDTELLPFKNVHCERSSYAVWMARAKVATHNAPKSENVMIIDRAPLLVITNLPDPRCEAKGVTERQGSNKG
jgi:hypothetical protein